MNSQAYKEDKVDAITKSQLINTSAVKSKLHLLCVFEKCKYISNGSPTCPRQQNAVPLHGGGVTESERNVSLLAIQRNKERKSAASSQAQLTIHLFSVRNQRPSYDKTIPTFWSIV
uniref:Uncharacterized protein n=1 Tax=Glossina austeni TaxID=7395 RepID=A0A1A9VX87_GLOAU